MCLLPHIGGCQMLSKILEIPVMKTGSHMDKHQEEVFYYSIAFVQVQ
jgi:hypothetical protein